ncbi:glycosyltransferase [Synechococcus sp. PCC 7336]|uniref:glycosyltransferase family 2 protein n=1 Tax=Synechococcus sp. PCC 7336 TaxID=195250 RepID=UPI00034C8F76|nr:glycosyltransferase [Synechococcus sp. PCC 7336]
MQAEFPIPVPAPVAANVLVSVMISNYNYGQYIGQAIDSVLAQTYPHVELIVVDDGSVDGSRQAIASYGDRLTAIFQDNSGQGPAFTAGIERSRGDIICLLDADDYFHPQKVARVVEAFARHPEWVQLSHGRVTVDKDGGKMGRDPTFFNRGDVRSLLLQYGRYAWAVTSALSYRRWVLETVAPIPARPKAADTYLTATVPFFGEVGAIADPLMYRRQHGNNRRAKSNNIDYLIEQRQDSRDCINRAAELTGLRDRFDIGRDADYLSYLAAQRGRGSLADFAKILRLTLSESLALGQATKDTLERLLRRGTCALVPEQGKLVMGLGPRHYLRYKLTGEEPQNRKRSAPPTRKEVG